MPRSAGSEVSCPTFGTTPPLRVVGPATPITSMESWFAAAPPKRGQKQWVDERSAKELARAWCRGSRPAAPQELLDALATHPDTRRCVVWEAQPEHVTVFDDAGGEGRNHDLVAVGVADGGPTLLGVEAKAGEPFGDTVEKQLAYGRGKRGSQIPRRVELLLNALGMSAAREVPAELASRGYQLLTASIGTVVEAGLRHCEQAVLVVHEFRPASPPPALRTKLEAGARDLDAFIDVLSQGAQSGIAAGSTLGPFAVAPTEFVPAGVRLYVCKVETVLRTDSHL